MDEFPHGLSRLPTSPGWRALLALGSMAVGWGCVSRRLDVVRSDPAFDWAALEPGGVTILPAQDRRSAAVTPAPAPGGDRRASAAGDGEAPPLTAAEAEALARTIREGLAATRPDLPLRPESARHTAVPTIDSDLVARSRSTSSEETAEGRVEETTYETTRHLTIRMVVTDTREHQVVWEARHAAADTATTTVTWREQKTLLGMLLQPTPTEADYPDPPRREPMARAAAERFAWNLPMSAERRDELDRRIADDSAQFAVGGVRGRYGDYGVGELALGVTAIGLRHMVVGGQLGCSLTGAPAEEFGAGARVGYLYAGPVIGVEARPVERLALAATLLVAGASVSATASPDPDEHADRAAEDPPAPRRLAGDSVVLLQPELAAGWRLTDGVGLRATWGWRAAAGIHEARFRGRLGGAPVWGLALTLGR